MFQKRITILLFLCLLGFNFSASAQTSGSIRGEIHDQDGQPLPGATVTISSPALIGTTRTATTNELGVFRFPSLPIGTYKVEVSMQGFENIISDNVKVSLGATANVPLTMKMTAVTESLTVEAESPILDVTQSGLSTSYKKEILEEVPTQRTMWDLMQASPGMSQDYGDNQSANFVAFGSSRQSNSWNIDGVDVTGPETGKAWWYVNPDVIDEIQVLGVGAPAEYGNFTGAALNIVTKSGGNSFHGTANYFFQTEGLTGVNVRLPDSPYTFNRDKYADVTGQLGGPILKDRLWFFGAVEILRDASTTPGVNPAFAPTQQSDKYDLKVTSRLGEKNQLSGFYHDELYDYPNTTSQFITQSASGTEPGDNPAWGATLTSTLKDNLLLEVNYSGWTSHDRYKSVTGSLEDPVVQFFDVGPTLYSGGLDFPYTYTLSRDQVNGKATYYADKFLKSQHEFRFGVQYSHGTADTVAGYGASGVYNYTYTYNYYGTSYTNFYQYQQQPFHYGGVTHDVGLFVDDTVTVNDKLTLNLGVRFDRNRGSIPDFKEVVVGTPSFTDVANWVETDKTIPGLKNYISWNTVSPRLGFVWQPRGDGRSVIEGSFGVYYDHDVIGNWDVPTTGNPPVNLFELNQETGQYELISSNFSNVGFNPNIKPPRALQYAAGYEQQITPDSTVGVQYVYKDTKDLIGFEILGGSYEPVPFTDPFTGKQYTLLSIVDQPRIQKGNRPGDFPGAPDSYFQKYQAVVLTYNKRFSDKWALDASYTWSKSTGLIPRPRSQDQNDPFYGSAEGSDPNDFLNAEGRLQGDRPNMFRAQAVFFKLPWDIVASAAVDFSSGKATTRQIRTDSDLLNQGSVRVIMAPGGSYRFPATQSIDLSFGKVFNLSNAVHLRLDAQLFNLLNSDQVLSYDSLTLQNPEDTFVPDAWMQPRRLQVRVGVQF